MSFTNQIVNYFPSPRAIIKYESEDKWNYWISVYRVSNLEEVNYEARIALYRESAGANFPPKSPIPAKVIEFYKSLTSKDSEDIGTFEVESRKSNVKTFHVYFEGS